MINYHYASNRKAKAFEEINYPSVDSFADDKITKALHNEQEVRVALTQRIPH